MSSNRLPWGAEFRRRVIGRVGAFAFPPVAIVWVGWIGILDLGEAEWKWLLGLMALGAVAGGAVAWLWLCRILAPVCAHLDRRCEGPTQREPTRENPPRSAFATVLDLPRKSAWVGSTAWMASTPAIALAMRVRFAAWSAFDAAVVTLSGVGVGFVVGCFVYLGIRRVVQPVREALASEFSDPAERHALTRHVPIRRKLLAGAIGVALVPLIFGLLLAQAQATRSIEDLTTRWQRVALASAAVQWSHPTADRTRGVGSYSDLPIEVSIVELARGEIGRARFATEIREHLRGEIDRGVDSGSSARLDDRMIFSWRRLDDQRVLVAATPRGELSTSGLWGAVAVLLVVSMAIAVGLATMFSNDTGRTTRALRAEADRIVSGDLSPGLVFESEDEWGELARSFQQMGSTLWANVARVATAAGRVESMASEIAGLAGNVVGMTVDQRRGIEQTTTSMEGINDQAKAIAKSSCGLNLAVEAASSSVLELGAVKQELDATARVLSTQVDEVSNSIEEMMLSVREVSENASALGDTSTQMSASMDQIAMSLREVDTSAEESARLSREVVEGAESGQEKVRQTIAGMEAIRDATETAEQVIRNLGNRTNEIGAIVDVIDDVADETNLLALNAAIIAAQAGEHGRAFAVVADQIKDLADRVLVRTKEIGGLIRGLQSESANAIGAVERGGASVASGVDLSAEAGVSLEEITRASRESGTRIAEIVTAVREQAEAAGHLVDLMERVRSGVEEIRSASGKQRRGNDAVYRGAIAMREVVEGVRGTSARGSVRILESVEQVRESAEQIHVALQGQSMGCASAVECLGDLRTRTRSNQELSQQMEGAVREILREAVGLRKDLGRLRIASGDDGSRL